MKNCYLINFDEIGNDENGYLIALEENKQIPFDIKRVYYTHRVPCDSKRGFHAHHNLEQVLVCLSGKVIMKCFDGSDEIEYSLDSPNKGVYIGPMVWHEMYGYTEETVLMAVASDLYKEVDYIRSMDLFMELVNDEK
ncbi:MAG: FdtA/QdtA family cupin domain-containing protein [Acidaminobacteraceae bacterium]